MTIIQHDLQTYRKRSVFTQQDIADLIGTMDVIEISRHEIAELHPQLELLLLYLLLFQLPVERFFPEHMKLLSNRLKLRIPNIIDELQYVPQNGTINQKIDSLKRILSSLNQNYAL